jgi:hypothetical protein
VLCSHTLCSLMLVLLPAGVSRSVSIRSPNPSRPAAPLGFQRAQSQHHAAPLSHPCSYPDVAVIGSAYPVAPWKVPVTYLIQALQVGLIGVCIFGDRLWQQLGIPPPAWYTQHVVSNRFGAAMGIFFVGRCSLWGIAAQVQSPPAQQSRA